MYDVSYCVDSEKALINEDDCQERELRVNCADSLSRHVLGVFGMFFFPLIYASHFNDFMRFVCLFIERLI